jgi:outer membrane lipoprotein LolB
MRQSALLLVLLLLLTACSLQSPAKPDWEAGKAALLVAEQWEFKGRMAVKIDDPEQRNQQSGGQASINWQQVDVVSRIRLSGPLGIGAWELVWSPEQVTASDAKGERTIRYTGPAAAEKFMRSELGWVFPADSIRFWVRGLPAPHAGAKEQFDADGRLALIRQQDWEVTYDRYGNFDGLQLPARLTISGKGVRLRLVITRWELNESSD